MGHDQQEQTTGPSPRAVVYVRISDDPEGTERGVDRQEADCRAYAAAHGWEVAAVFRENDTSAFKQRTITLPSVSDQPSRSGSKPSGKQTIPARDLGQ
jgi:site-specific DNA recombinase